MPLSAHSLNWPVKRPAILRISIESSFFFLIFFFWIWHKGVPLSNSSRLTLIVAIQVASGSCIWQRLSWRLSPSIQERLGMGLAIGTAASTILDQIFLNTLLSPIAWLLPSCFIVFLSWRRPLPTQTNGSGSIDIRWMYLAIAALIFGFGTIRYGYGVMILGLAAGYVVSREKNLWFQSITFAFSLIFGFLALVLLRPTVEYGNWRMRPLYTGTDDLVFSESLSHSLSHFGLSDYGAAVGTHIRYHWFSLAWSGLTSRVAGSDPFDVTLHVVPVVAFLGIFALTWTLVFKLTKSHNASNFSILVLFCSNSLPEDMRFFYVLNTSNVVSHIWLLAALLIFVYAIETKQKRWIPVFASVLSASLLAKLPYGVVLLTGTSIALVYAVIRFSFLRLFALSMLLVSVFSSFLIYIVFLKPSPWEQRSFSFSFNPFGFGQPTLWSVPTTLVLIFAALSMRFPISTAIFKWTDSATTQVVLVCLSVGSLSGLASFVFDGGSAEKYFLNASLIFGAVLTAYSIFVLSKSVDSKRVRNVLFACASSFCLALLLFGAIKISFDLTSFPLGSNSQILIAPFIAIVVSVAVYSLQSFCSREFQSSFHHLLFAGIIGVSSGVFALQALTKDPYHFTESVASTTDLESLDWVRENVNSTNILATNRFLCIQEVPCSFDDSSFLISAVSRRRVLIEGPRFVIGGMPYPVWVKDRIQASVDFANSPSYETWLQLKNFDVDWFYLDTNFITSELNPMNTPWNEWATVAYHNSNVYILKLKE